MSKITHIRFFCFPKENMPVFVLVKLGNELPSEGSTIVVPSDVRDLLGRALNGILGFRRYVAVHSGH
jgi:hypothetical protein